MKKSTKSLWIYAAVLFAVAIGLILLATFTQAKLVRHDGGFEVLDTLNQNLEDNAARLTEENIALQGKIADLDTTLAHLTQERNDYQQSAQRAERIKQSISALYAAYQAEDFEQVATLLPQLTKEELDGYLPGFYDEVQADLEQYQRAHGTQGTGAAD